MSRCVECLINDVSRAFDLRPSELRGPVRTKRHGNARAAFAKLCRDEKGASWAQITTWALRADRRSARDWKARADRLIANNPGFAASYERARAL